MILARKLSVYHIASAECNEVFFTHHTSSAAGLPNNVARNLPVMLSSQTEGPLSKRRRCDSVASRRTASRHPKIFAPYRTVGLVSPTDVPFTSIPLGKTTFQITTSVGRALQTYDLSKGLKHVFVTRPQTPAEITATCAWKTKVLAAWGDPTDGGTQGLWLLQRGKTVAELELPLDLQQKIGQILVFGSWIVACTLTRIEVWKTATLEHYTSLFTMAAKTGDNELTGGIQTMPTYLNKIFAGRRDGWVEIWNVLTGKLVYTILPPSPKSGAVTCLEPTPALSLMAMSYADGTLAIQNVLTDKPVLRIIAGTEDAPVTSISFRSDGQGAGTDGRKAGVMATATTSSGDVTFWDLNNGGRIAGVLRSAHNPPSQTGRLVRGGVRKIEFLSGQPVIVTSGRDNALKTWIFDVTPFSPIPRILHRRSGPAAPVTTVEFLPSDFDGAEAGNKWLLIGAQDRSLWGWSLRRDGQSTELSQGAIERKAKKAGILARDVLRRGPTTSLEDLKAAEITAIACSLNRDGGMGALPGKQPIWQDPRKQKRFTSAEISATTGWESVLTAHRDDSFARTWFWGRKRAGRWKLPTGDGRHVSTLAMSSCGTFAVVGSAGGNMELYNLQSGLRQKRAFSKRAPARGVQGYLPHNNAVTGLVVDSLNKYIVSCSVDGKVKFWDFMSGRLVHEINWGPSAVTGCRYHAANDLIAFSCDDHSVRVVDIDRKQKARQFGDGKAKINDFAFSHDGRWIVAATQDCILWVWDIPNGHRINVFRLETPCTALAFSATGEYLATASEHRLGVDIWTNKTLFMHVPTTKVSDQDIEQISGPTTSGEGGQGLIDAAFEGDMAPEESESLLVPTLDQLSADLMTLSLVPRSRWQTLLHLDLIKQRNKPKEAPKAPEKAPFFLPSTNGTAPLSIAGSEKRAADGQLSRITRFDQSALEEVFTTKLRDGATSGDYNPFIDHLKGLPPSSADLQLRSLSAGDGDECSNELLHFIRALTSRLLLRRDYELIQAWMTVFLRLHSDVIMESRPSLAALRAWKEQQAVECARLDNLVGYCSGVVGFLRSPRS